jgi:NADH-quinone oxidoreductase subunit D
MTMVLYTFREREDLMDVYEAVSGARLHAAYYRPGGVYRDLPDRMPQYEVNKFKNAETVRRLNENRQGSLLDFLEDFTDRFPTYVDEYETLLTDNRIWKQRTVGIGVVTPERALASASPARCCAARASSGTCARSSPTRSTTASISTRPVGVNGDCYDRYLVRIEEMRQSNRIISSASTGCARTPVRSSPTTTRWHRRRASDEGQHGRADPPLQAVHRGHARAEGEAYAAVEHPKGEFGIYAMSDGANKPYRLKLRSPGFPHLAATDEMAKGHMIADAVGHHRHHGYRVRRDRSMTP